MNFQDLVKIENSDFYLDLAFSRAKKAGDETRNQKFRDRLEKSKEIESKKLKTISRTLRSHLTKIVENFPSFNQLPLFYKELCDLTMDINLAKKHLATVTFALNKIDEFSTKYLSKIKFSRNPQIINEHRRSYYGRISSILKQLKIPLEDLEVARKIMRSYPSVKTSLPTVSICGFPNVGKSTLLKSVTNADIKIRDYAFTTTRLLMGYKEVNNYKVQFIDTPGVLNREDTDNNVELLSYLAIKHLAKVVVFVIDLSISCGYEINEQLGLLNRVKQIFPFDIIIYFSKEDLLEKEIIEEYKEKLNKYDCYTSKEELIDALVPHLD